MLLRRPHVTFYDNLPAHTLWNRQHHAKWLMRCQGQYLHYSIIKAANE